MFNAVFKIPMQFFILLLGALVFVFYQFEPPPVFFNRSGMGIGHPPRHRRTTPCDWSCDTPRPTRRSVG